ncbi:MULTISPECIES: DUF2076 domain-containing protein [Methylosinus]|uniref:DUF2076 domain-containing protein n=1 Tax=Methylosinus trichosporium (strain ATCC 35070 / NCIMB 11131 / UNIQEM 75 / OB3b) TaxID=595536 RepID=A0A2D2CVL8_METT3|nr:MULTISPECIES: DUF2076 domain-containing protein [Methylosinus]ATQ66842.1 DUF2076 domain-containing protein [Methylosinus trichosporium OB3b]OBS54286.1 ABC transporter substrate-binding protein [Methylosinus sp. 3S-1]
MSPEERQLLAGLFDRTRSASAAPRDQEAESFIAEQLKSQPAAPYLLAQTVLVQEQALQAASQRLQEMESRVNQLESQPQPSGGFLGSLFGQRTAPPPPPRPAFGQGQGQPGYPQSGPWGAPPPAGGPSYGQPPAYPPQQQGFAAPQQASAGGGFLKGALGTAAGVAGGVLLADSLRGLFHGGAGGNLGIGQGLDQHAGLGGGDTIINNYYGDQGGQPYPDAGYDGPQSNGPDVQGADYDDGGFQDDGGDGGFDV